MDRVLPCWLQASRGSTIAAICGICFGWVSGCVGGWVAAPYCSPPAGGRQVLQVLLLFAAGALIRVAAAAPSSCCLAEDKGASPLAERSASLMVTLDQSHNATYSCCRVNVGAVKFCGVTPPAPLSIWLGCVIDALTHVLLLCQGVGQPVVPQQDDDQPLDNNNNNKMCHQHLHAYFFHLHQQRWMACALPLRHWALPCTP